MIKNYNGLFLIKIQSHPCAGKTTFIRKHCHNNNNYSGYCNYRGLNLLDIDKLHRR